MERYRGEIQQAREVVSSEWQSMYYKAVCKELHILFATLHCIKSTLASISKDNAQSDVKHVLMTYYFKQLETITLSASKNN